ncbi:MAG: hypothetical protein K2Q97_04925 [Burkholderiaceae bacterium]|nr:hypothetical protein [Burkholderiaceae bacterium]
MCLFFVALAPSQATEVASAGAPTETSPANRKAEQEQIRQDRETMAVLRQRNESACHQRFAVEDCLSKVRSQMREGENRLRIREIQLNDKERKDNASERLRLIQQKQASLPATATVSSFGGGNIRSQPIDLPEATAQRIHAADQRAQQHQQVLAAQRDQVDQMTAHAARAAKARTRQAQALKAAESRRAMVQQSQAKALKSGRLPAGHLPDPPPTLQRPG